MSDKYPRTYHLPWSPGGTSDDKRLPSADAFINTQIIITEKLDGSNVCLEQDACYSRSHAGPPTHASFDQFKAFHAGVKHLIPANIQIFGEWCYALHSIKYTHLPHYFNVFGVRDTILKKWFSWEEVVMWAEEVGAPVVPVIFDGIVKTEEMLKQTTEHLSAKPSIYGPTREGLVVRVVGSFADDHFAKSVAKWVRSNHVQTSEHWKDQEIIRNGLIK